VPESALPQSLDGVDVGEAAPADDPDPVGDMLYLVQGVRRQEHGAALGGGLREQRAQLGLEQRVEAARGLVENHQLGPVHESLHEADLLPVPLGEVTDRPVEDEGKALAEAIPQLDVDAAAKPSERIELLARVIRSERRKSPGRYPIRRRASTPLRRGSSPSTVARPAVGLIRSSNSLIVVLLPAPFGPR
jgi:transglutaminase-like putative cysteine protease